MVSRAFARTLPPSVRRAIKQAGTTTGETGGKSIGERYMERQRYYYTGYSEGVPVKWSTVYERARQLGLRPTIKMGLPELKALISRYYQQKEEVQEKLKQQAEEEKRIEELKKAREFKEQELSKQQAKKIIETARKERLKETLEAQKKAVSETETQLVATQGGRKTVITERGDILAVPESATVRGEFVKREKKYAVLTSPEQRLKPEEKAEAFKQFKEAEQKEKERQAYSSLGRAEEYAKLEQHRKVEERSKILGLTLEEAPPRQPNVTIGGGLGSFLGIPIRAGEKIAGVETKIFQPPSDFGRGEKFLYQESKTGLIQLAEPFKESYGEIKEFKPAMIVDETRITPTVQETISGMEKKQTVYGKKKEGIAGFVQILTRTGEEVNIQAPTTANIIKTVSVLTVAGYVAPQLVELTFKPYVLYPALVVERFATTGEYPTPASLVQTLSQTGAIIGGSKILTSAERGVQKVIIKAKELNFERYVNAYEKKLPKGDFALVKATEPLSQVSTSPYSKVKTIEMKAKPSTIAEIQTKLRSQTPRKVKYQTAPARLKPEIQKTLGISRTNVPSPTFAKITESGKRISQVRPTVQTALKELKAGEISLDVRLERIRKTMGVAKTDARFQAIARTLAEERIETIPKTSTKVKRGFLNKKAQIQLTTQRERPPLTQITKEVTTRLIPPTVIQTPKKIIKPEIRVGIFPEYKPKEEIYQEQERRMPVLLFQEKLKQFEFIGQKPRVGMTQPVGIMPDMRSSTEIRQEINQRQGQEQEERKVGIFPFYGQKTIVERPPERPPPEEPPKLMPFLFPEATAFTKKQVLTGYDTYVRERGRFVKQNIVPNPLNKAINIGVDVTDNTPATDFQIRKSKRKASQGVDEFRDVRLGMKFDEIKENYWREKVDYRIDSFGEVQRIPKKGTRIIRQQSFLRRLTKQLVS